MICELVAEAVAAGARRQRACQLLGLSVRTLERWAGRDGRDVRWVVRENMRKARMRRADAESWERLQARLDAG